MSASRVSKLTSSLAVDRQEGLEIGPLCWPIVTKDQGQVKYVDYTSTASLKVKFSGHPTVIPDRIVDVDYPLEGRSIREVIEPGKMFDYVIASHVIEHLPDPIGFLEELTGLLRTGGHICLAIPDRRYTFDYFRSESVLADLVDAYLRKLRRPSARQVFDHFSNMAEVPLTAAWDGTLDPDALKRTCSLSHALDLAKRTLSGEYVDVHCHVFTPASFFRLLRGCFELDLLQLAVAGFHDTCPNELEFFVTLKRLDPKLRYEARRAIQQRSLPAMAGGQDAVTEAASPVTDGLLVGSQTGGFEGRIFYISRGIRYWVPSPEWGTRAGFRWPDDIVWLTDDEIGLYRAAVEPIPEPDQVKRPGAE